MKKLLTVLLAFLLIFTFACNNQEENNDVEKPVVEEKMELEDYLSIERSLKYPEMYFLGDYGKVIEDDSLSKILDLNFSFTEDPGGEKFKGIIREIFKGDYIIEGDWETIFSTGITNGVYLFEYDQLTATDDSFFAARIYLDQEKRAIGNTCYGIKIPWDDSLMEELKDYVNENIQERSEGQLNLEKFENLVY